MRTLGFTRSTSVQERQFHVDSAQDLTRRLDGGRGCRSRRGCGKRRSRRAADGRDLAVAAAHAQSSRSAGRGRAAPAVRRGSRHRDDRLLDQPQSVRRPRIHLGSPGGGTGQTVEAETRTYRDALSQQEVYVHHARITGLRPDTTYLYSAGHDGAAQETGSFTTAPRGRAAFTFTSFGDQGTPNLRRSLKWPTEDTPPPLGPFRLYTSTQGGTEASADIVAAVERVGPLFNLINGDLCYAGVAGAIGEDRVATWADWFINNSRSARLRPWMPCVGNGETEKGNGPLGVTGYQTYFALPDATTATDEETRGLWYAFTVGGVRFISLANDDVAIVDSGDIYLRGYSGGAQRRWLERELQAARASTAVDWIVVFMHHPMISSHRSGGGDLGVRQEWGPLFDAYGVDLVLCGHEHYYERSLPLRGTLPNETRTPIPVSTGTDVADTGKGTVHMVIGGGGNFATTQDDLFEEPKGRVVVDVGKVPEGRHRKAFYLTEDAPGAPSRTASTPMASPPSTSTRAPVAPDAPGCTSRTTPSTAPTES
ncbi:metallophosphoesterase family protein [Streptomyces diastatochromogenes]|nr:metallophosphoesterase family protein [Streptomyces diastatochromogenes]